MKKQIMGYKNMFIDTEIHTNLKIAACKANVSMREFVKTAITEKIAAMETKAKKN
ncbi:MAG TPA: hypothetical protein PKK26_18420 [Candidatus Wallbacteria bacterium]|nr:hypothetical protein [Candidatus Wallbacteria bacterium]